MKKKKTKSKSSVVKNLNKNITSKSLQQQMTYSVPKYTLSTSACASDGIVSIGPINWNEESHFTKVFLNNVNKNILEECCTNVKCPIKKQYLKLFKPNEIAENCLICKHFKKIDISKELIRQEKIKAMKEKIKV